MYGGSLMIPPGKKQNCYEGRINAERVKVTAPNAPNAPNAEKKKRKIMRVGLMLLKKQRHLSG